MATRKPRQLNPPLGERQGKVPTLAKEERTARNNRILALFIAGWSERDIGKAVNLTGQRVHQIIKAELKNEVRHQQLVSDQALALYTARLDTLLRAVWPKVAQGDLKGVETARRILEQIGRLYDIESERIGALPPANDLLNISEDMDPRDELAKFRARHSRPGDSVVHSEAQ